MPERGSTRYKATKYGAGRLLSSTSLRTISEVLAFGRDVGSELDSPPRLTYIAPNNRRVNGKLFSKDIPRSKVRDTLLLAPDMDTELACRDVSLPFLGIRVSPVQDRPEVERVSAVVRDVPSKHYDCGFLLTGEMGVCYQVSGLSPHDPFLGRLLRDVASGVPEHNIRLLTRPVGEGVKPPTGELVVPKQLAGISVMVDRLDVI